MSDPYRFSPALTRWFVFGGAAACVGTIALMWLVTSAMGATMSAHGWAALVAGVVVSFALGLGLSALLVWGRRNGYDDAAHDMAKRINER